MASFKVTSRCTPGSVSHRVFLGGDPDPNHEELTVPIFIPSGKLNIYNIYITLLKIAIEIVDLPIKTGDFQ